MSEATKKPAAKPSNETPSKNAGREVVKWILAGHAEADIVDAIGKQWPGQKAKPLIVQAIAEIAEAGNVDEKLVRGFALEATREIFRKASEVADHATALRALKQMTEIAKS
jgi:hypothetical protein